MKLDDFALIEPVGSDPDGSGSFRSVRWAMREVSMMMSGAADGTVKPQLPAMLLYQKLNSRGIRAVYQGFQGEGVVQLTISGCTRCDELEALLKEGIDDYKEFEQVYSDGPYTNIEFDIQTTDGVCSIRVCFSQDGDDEP